MPIDLTTNSIVNTIGFGDSQFKLAVYIANQPNLPEYQKLNQLISLDHGDIARIGQACGNGWRKVFNVYAKLLYELDEKHFSFSTRAPTWQQYRDQYLLQAESDTALVFSAPTFNLLSDPNESKTLHIICGRTYAKQLIHDGLDIKLNWLDEEFAIDLGRAVIACPYFDYRQLSNHKIKRLSVMLTGVLKGEIADLNE